MEKIIYGENIRFTGRWNCQSDNAVASAPGAYFEFAFRGKTAVIHFDLEANDPVRPHLFISIDGAAQIESVLDSFIRISASSDCNHVVKVVFKSAVEPHNRWTEPLVSKVTLSYIEMREKGLLSQDSRPIIEFLGDSITEGISIDTHLTYYDDFISNCVYWNDSTASYAWLTAEALNLRPAIFGYGCLGLTHGGSGNVPPALKAYPYCYDNAERNYTADYIVINYGANDRGADASGYISLYKELLKVVSKENPGAKIFVLPSFCGFCNKELYEMVSLWESVNGCSVNYIESSGWIAPEPLHPDRSGHEAIAEKLVSALKDYL